MGDGLNSKTKLQPRTVPVEQHSALALRPVWVKPLRAKLRERSSLAPHEAPTDDIVHLPPSLRLDAMDKKKDSWSLLEAILILPREKVRAVGRRRAMSRILVLLAVLSTVQNSRRQVCT
jgi:hypothetical protein